MNDTQTGVYQEGWGAYGALIMSTLTLLINIHQSYKAGAFSMFCFQCSQIRYDLNYKENNNKDNI